MRFLISVLAVFFCFKTFAELGLHQSLHLLKVTKPDTRFLTIKYRDQLSPSHLTMANGGPCAQCKVKPLNVVPLFSRGAKSYAYERKIYARTDQAKLENYFHFDFGRSLNTLEGEAILRAVYEDPNVELAYFDPRLELPVVKGSTDSGLVNTTQTPNFESLQFYLDKAPFGVDARYGWSLPGGAGAGVKIIDIEMGWDLRHEDFSAPFFVAPGSDLFESHGTAVWGEIAAKNDGKGVTGIAHESDFGVSIALEVANDEEFFSTVVPQAMDLAASKLVAGDIMIIELHGPGPDQGNYMPVEYYPAIFDVIKSATDRGVIVVAAAGNGNSNLDDAAYKGAFDVSVRDSGAIIVGAGGAPGGPDLLERMYFSCYGSRVDAFAFGESVVTTGYGDLQAGTNATYTAEFGGTSSATPIVTGVVASLSGIARTKGRVLRPSEVREALRKTGTRQRGKSSERIGNLPNLRELVPYLKLD